MSFKREYKELMLSAELFSEANNVNPLRMRLTTDVDVDGKKRVNLTRGITFYPATKYGRSCTVRFDGVTRYELIFDDPKNCLMGTVETDSADVAYETMYNCLERNIMPAF